MPDPAPGDIAKWDGELWVVVEYLPDNDRVVIETETERTSVRVPDLAWVRKKRLSARAR